MAQLIALLLSASLLLMAAFGAELTRQGRPLTGAALSLASLALLAYLLVGVGDDTEEDE